MEPSDSSEKAWSFERKAVILALVAIGAAGFNSLTDYFVPLIHLMRPGAEVWVLDDGDSPVFWEYARLAPSMQQEYRSNLQSKWIIYLVRWVLWSIGPLVTLLACSSKRSWIRQIALAWLMLNCVVCVLFAFIPPNPEEFMNLEPILSMLVAFLTAAATIGGFGILWVAVSIHSTVKLAGARGAIKSEE